MKNLLIALLLIPVCLFSRAAAETGDGGYAGSFLQLGLSARAVGMGQAYYGVSDDASAIFYNPAGSVFELKRRVGFSYRVMDMDRKLGYASFDLPARGEAMISFGWIFKGVGGVIERDELGEPGEKLDDSENALMIGFTRRFSRFVAVGGTGKYLLANLAGVKTNTVSFDVGTYVKLSKGEGLSETSSLDFVRFGLVVANLGASYIWTTGDYWKTRGQMGDSRTDDFPILVGGGVSVMAFDRRILAAVDARKYQWQSLTLHGGAEYAVSDALKVRAGLDDFHPTFGGGVSKKFDTYELRLDYAFSASKAGERSDHIFSLGFVF
jgi:hypothetical protein